MPFVYLTEGCTGIGNMFRGFGWEITNDLQTASLIQFGGGADVSPQLYGENPHSTTRSDLDRDKREMLLFKFGVKNKLPMAGICRGGQFLNVMCGGRLWQNVDNHALAGSHKMHDHVNDRVIDVTSTHHQMMIPSEKALVLGEAKLATKKERMGATGKPFTVHTPYHPDDDPEVVLYYLNEVPILCFQPHPEIPGYPEMTSLYFELIHDWLDAK